MNACYKAQNFNTAAFYARKILAFEPTGVSFTVFSYFVSKYLVLTYLQMFKNKPDVITQYKKFYAAFKKKGTNQFELSFNPEELSST